MGRALVPAPGKNNILNLQSNLVVALTEITLCYVPVGLASITNAFRSDEKKCSSAQHRLCQRSHMSNVLVIAAPSNNFYCRAAVEKEEYPAILNNWNLWLREGKPRPKSPGCGANQLT